MKKIIFILALFVSFVANAQYTPPTGYTNINSRYDWLAGVFRSLGLPAGGNAAFTAGQSTRAGAIYYDSTGVDSGLYVWTGLYWRNHSTSNNGFFSPDQTSTGSTQHDGGGFNFSLGNVDGLTFNAQNTIINSLNNGEFLAGARLYIEAGDSIRFTSINGIYNFQNVIEEGDTTLVKPFGWTASGGLRRVNFWPGSGGGSGDNTNAGAFYRWLKPTGQEIKTFAPGYGFILDSTTNTDALTATLDSATVFPHIRSSIALQFDSLGTDVNGISPMTARNNILYSRRMYVTGGGYYDTTASGGLRLNLTPVSQFARLQKVASLASATTNVVIMGNRIWATNYDSTYWYAYAVTDSVSTAVSYDSDAENYMTRVESAGRTLTLSEKSAINDYVVTLKAEGIWTKIYDRGLPIWGTSAPSLETLKDVSSPTAVASPSFTSSGVEFNGTTQYLTTGIVPNTAVTLTSAHLSYYSQDDVTETSVDIGASSTSSNRMQLLSKVVTTGTIGRMWNTSAGQVASTTPTSSAGYFMVSRVSGTDLRLFYNGSQVGTTVNTTGGALPTHGIYVGAQNDSGTAATFSTRKCSMWSIGAGLTTAEALADKNATETFMDAMGIGVIP